MSCIEPLCSHEGLIAPYDRVPLGIAAEMYVNYKSEGTEAVWPRAMRDWDIVRRESENVESQFLDRISPFQKQLVLLLCEWWTSMTEENQNIMRMLKEFMQTNTEGPIPQSIQDQMSAYCFTLYNLFVSEFVDLTPVTFQRRTTQDKAGWVAACRRAATQTASRVCGSLHAAKGDAERRLALESEAADHLHISFHGGDEPAPGGSLNAILEACPWLPDHAKHGLPYFLWDVEGRRTIRFREDDKRPDYAIISHTWGRWRLWDQAQIELPGVPWTIPRNTRFDVTRLPEELFDNVNAFGGAKFVWLDLFCIPQDGSELAKIEIGRQAAIFGNATRAICWMSNIDDLTGLQLAITWLAMAFARHEDNLNDRQIDGAFMLVDSMTRKCPGIGFREGIFSTTIPRQETLASASRENVDKGWFTSLWTLQEATLRPDMVFCDRNWKLLSTVTETRPMPLDYILALANWYRRKLTSELAQHNRLSRHASADPLPVIELCTLLDQSGLAGLMFAHSALAVLAAADRRQCQSRRAEAIMSVVGSRMWYAHTDTDAEREANLILGRYPVQFLRETREREGASFFASQYGNFCCFWDTFTPLKEGDNSHECLPRWPFTCQTCQKSYPPRLGKTTRVAGTMLPFDPLRYSSKLNFLVPRDIGHPTLEDWKIADDGRIIVSKACIIASTDPTLHSIPTTARPNTAVWYVWGPKTLDAETMIAEVNGNMCGCRTTDLDWYLSHLGEEKRMKHIILTLIGRTMIQGVVLMQVNASEEAGRIYSKLGDVKILNAGRAVAFHLQVKEVNWEIF